jgi:glycosyltransferase involved in cell wall biosynthesis
MPSVPIVSVVMPVFNGEPFLRESVDSILNQTYRNFEFVIINDGSTDGSTALLARFAQADSRVRVFWQRNQGYVVALNRGCALARGKYMVRLDADDVAIPDRLERQMDFLERHPEVAVVGGAVEGIDGAGTKLFLDRPPLEDGKIRDGLHAMTFPLCHPAVAIRKKAFDDAGGYRTQFEPAEDYDLWLRIIEAWQVANVPGVVVRKRIHPCQESTVHLRQQIIAVVGAIAAAAIRRKGQADPTCDVERISEALLQQMGVTMLALRKAQVEAYLYWIETMTRMSQDDAALRLIGELAGLADCDRVHNPTFSNSWLTAARIYFRRGEPFRALACAGRAVMARPMILGRPLKRGVQHLFHEC